MPSRKKNQANSDATEAMNKPIRAEAATSVPNRGQEMKQPESVTGAGETSVFADDKFGVDGADNDLSSDTGTELDKETDLDR